ncbi:helix-turn-helix domain-containing protein [Streptomyces sp. NPDC014777]|uniref:helix-turn-helix domain-containing protein n=1 Tax=Streptomyces sp. NPDC014777 TaxID=3364910 RepID=UPI003702D0A0
MSAWDTGSRADDGGTVSARDEIEEFTALLRRLKDRTGRSYGSLARRVNMNTSTLHRYCAGEAVPQDFAPLERLAAFCEATPQERLELHRLWLSAVAARQRRHTSPSGQAQTASAQAPEPAPARVHTPAPEREPKPVPAAAPAPALAPNDPVPSPTPRPWYRRRRLLVSAAVSCALLATVGSLSALSHDRSSPADASRSKLPRATAPSTPVPHDSAKPPATPTLSPGASHHSGTPSAVPESPDPSATGSRHPTSSAEPAADPPLVYSADSQVWDMGCGHDYVVDKPPAQVPPPPVQQDAGAWAGSLGAVHGRQTMVQISVQGRSSTAVVLEALRVRVVSRGTPAAGNAYAMDQGCGGELTPRRFTVNLDADRPVARPKDGADSAHHLPAVHFPYRVSAEDPEVLLVDATTLAHDTRWYLELDWSCQGRTGTIRIDDHGRPFRTTGIGHMPRYWYGTTDTGTRAWVPYTG